MLKSSSLASQNIGCRSYWTKGKTVVDHERAGTITLSPGCNLPLWHKAAMANKFADEPELEESTL